MRKRTFTGIRDIQKAIDKARSDSARLGNFLAL